MARFLFCVTPAIPAGAVMGYLLGPVVGVLVGACMFGLGWSVTRARPERGETP